MKFSELQLNANVLEALDAMRFDECTPIQEQAIPIILEGKDLIAVAQTGTGKTAAFLLPVLNKLSEGKHPEDAINCVIMSPTRELAQQIDQLMEGFSYFMPVSSVAVYGGNDGILFEQQKKGLTLGADVVIATPGRLIAHLSLGYVDLSKVSYFILDEADRMLDMGFYEDIMQIAKYLPKERQTIMFSATMPAKIQQLANTILNNPSEIKLAVSKPAEKIIQAAYVCYENQKLGIIRSLFMDEVPERVIVFASSKIKVKEVAKALTDVGAVSTLKGGIILKKTSSATLEKTVGALTDEKFRERRGQEGLRQWQEQYDPSVVYQQWEDLLSSIASSRTPKQKD